MNVVNKNIDELIPYENNPRNNDEAVEYVTNSIKEFGFKVPVVIDTNNVIVAGHTRLKAAKKLGIKEIPCIVADDLSEEQIKAFRLADNKVSEFAKWDIGKLDAEFNLIDVLDMSAFGFSFYEPINDESLDGVQLHEKYLRFSTVKIPLTEEDEQTLLDLYDEYIAMNGVSYGFIEWLVHNEH